MKFLIGTTAYNDYWQNMALALDEAGALGAYFTGFVDHYRTPAARRLRRYIERWCPPLDRQMRRRRIPLVHPNKVYLQPCWEVLRTLAARARLNSRTVDQIFIRSEYGLDQACATALASPLADAFLGLEHGSLAALESARRLGKRGVVVFASPHHAYRRKWVDSEYERHPEWRDPDARRLLALGLARDARRDREMAAADQIITCSPLVSQTLVDAGVPEAKLTSVLLGAPDAIGDDELPASLPQPFVVLYAGPVSVRKGAHYLLEAWKRVGARSGGELHFYGAMLLPPAYATDAGANVVFHGSTTREELFDAYRRAAVLVFPTLCDGFGAVVTEAMSRGLPVITTPNAGASSFVQEGVNGFITPPGDAAALARTIAWCLDHPRELAPMRREALRAARAWNWDRFRRTFREAVLSPRETTV